MADALLSDEYFESRNDEASDNTIPINAGALLTDEFLEPYKTIRPKHAGVMFDVIYVRTYCRWIESLKRREQWWETCKRIVEYSLGLVGGSNYSKRAEAEQMYYKMFHLFSVPSGRTIWIGGTEAAQRNPESNYNCAALVFDRLEALTEIMHLLFGGSGVGFRILKSDVAKLPSLSTNFSVENMPYLPVPAGERRQETTVTMNPDGTADIVVGDTREGWVDAVSVFMEFVTDPVLYNGIHMRFNYNNVRPLGERLVSFGGFAAGPTPLSESLEGFEWIIKECGGILRPIQVLDLVCLMAKHMSSGGTRAAALIALGSPDDEEFINAKNDDKLGMMTEVNGKMRWVANPKTSHRTKSNNSVVFETKPSKETIDSIIESIKQRGEPGWFNIEAARKRRPDVQTLNPCGEILLDDKGVCNLATVFLPSFVIKGEDGPYVDMVELESSMRMSSRICTRMTNVTISMPEWDATQKRDRLLGVDVTGWMDAFDALGWDALSPQACELRRQMRMWANDEADKYAADLGIPRPLLVTTGKPNGTLSMLSTVSSGIARSWSKYYLRRVSVLKTDPVNDALVALGVPYEEDTTKDKSLKRKFLFPIESPAPICSQEEPFRDQFFRYLAMQDQYTDHNTSNTLLVGPDEWEEAASLIWEHWDQIVAISMLKKESIPSPYPQPPNEMMTEEQYRELKSRMPDLSLLPEMVNKYETLDAGLDDNDTCLNGVCPVR